MDERLKFVARLLDGEKMAVLCRGRCRILTCVLRTAPRKSVTSDCALRWPRRMVSAMPQHKMAP